MVYQPSLVISISNNPVWPKYTVELSKILLFQALKFCQTVLIQTVKISISIAFLYTQLNVKTILIQTIQFSIQNSSISNNSI